MLTDLNYLSEYSERSIRPSAEKIQISNITRIPILV